MNTSEIVIRPERKWFDFQFRELWNYRDLIFLFVRRDFVAYYKQTILGPLWFFIQPIFTTIVFMVVFGRIAQIPTQGIPAPLFYLSGIINWNYFADSLNKTSNTFVANSSVFGKVYFPRLVVPISIVISNMITYAIQLVLFIVVLLYNVASSGIAVNLNSTLLLFPLIILQMALLGLGTGIIVSSLTTKYKDLSFAVTFGVQLWMYATPIVYPLSQVPEKWKWLFYINPVAPVIEMFRNMIFSANTIDWSQYLFGWCVTVVILIIGVSLFNRVEKTFMDTV